MATTTAEISVEGRMSSMEDRCVSCGSLIPEGRQVCVECERKSHMCYRCFHKEYCVVAFTKDGYCGNRVPAELIKKIKFKIRNNKRNKE